MQRLYAAAASALLTAAIPLVANAGGNGPVIRTAPVMRIAPPSPPRIAAPAAARITPQWRPFTAIHPVVPVRVVLPATRYSPHLPITPRAFSAGPTEMPRFAPAEPSIIRIIPIAPVSPRTLLTRTVTPAAAPVSIAAPYRFDAVSVATPVARIHTQSRAFLPGFGAGAPFGFPEPWWEQHKGLTFGGILPFFTFGPSYVFIPNVGLVPNIVTSPFYGFGSFGGFSPFGSAFGSYASYGSFSPYAASPYSMPYYTPTPYAAPFNGTFTVPYIPSLYNSSGDPNCSADGYANPSDPSCAQNSDLLQSTVELAHVQGTIVRYMGTSMLVQTAANTQVLVDTGVAKATGALPATLTVGASVDVTGYYDGTTFIATAIH